MISTLLTPAVEWAAASNVPNWLLVVALLTRPSTWTGAVVTAIRSRLGSAGGS